MTLPEKERENIGIIRRNISLEVQLIDDLLDITRITQGKLHLNVESVDMHQLVHHTMSIVQHEAKTKKLNLTIDLRAAHQFTLADSSRMQQVLWNIIKNAIKFTPIGGNITITSFNEPAPPLTTDINNNNNNNNDNNNNNISNGSSPVLEQQRPLLKIVTLDTGIGIEPHILSSIFNSFEQGGEQVTHQFGGLGLGLVIRLTTSRDI